MLKRKKQIEWGIKRDRAFTFDMEHICQCNGLWRMYRTNQKRLQSMEHTYNLRTDNGSNRIISYPYLSLDLETSLFRIKGF